MGTDSYFASPMRLVAKQTWKCSLHPCAWLCIENNVRVVQQAQKIHGLETFHKKLKTKD